MSEARAEAERRWPKRQFDRQYVGFSEFLAGAEWQASRPPTEEDVERAAKAIKEKLRTSSPWAEEAARAALNAVRGER